MPPMKPQWVRCKLEEAIEKSCIDAPAHNPELCKGIPSDERVPSCQGSSQLMGNVYNLHGV
jgi:hypothetical protein